MRTSATVLGLLVCAGLPACAAGVTTLDDSASPAERADAATTPDSDATADGPGPVNGADAAGRPSDDGSGEVTDASTDDSVEDGGGPRPFVDGGSQTLGGLVIYQDGLGERFANHVPHDSAKTAQRSGADAAYLVVDTGYGGAEALQGSSIEVALVTIDDTGSFGIPLAFWLGSVGYRPDVFENIHAANSIHFSVKTGSGTGVLNVLTMSSTGTSTSLNVTVTESWQELTLSTAPGPDWVVYDAASFNKFVVLQLNFLAGANPPGGFKGGAKIYLDDMYIE